MATREGARTPRGATLTTRKPRRAHIALATSVYLAAACTAWRPEAASPTLFEEERPDRVRVTLRDSTRWIVQNPRIEGDSIVGGADGQRDRAAALAELQQLEVRRVDWQQTALIAVVGGALVVAAYLACFGLVSPCNDGS